MIYSIRHLLFLSLLIISFGTSAQQTITQAAGPEYDKSPAYQSLWGHNYRKDWITPVAFPVFMLDTAFGGLTPQKEGGGHQSKSLHLKSKSGKEYVIRSVNKNLKVVIPPILYNTFAEDIVNDQISMSHPYAALSVPLMAQAANINHTIPRYVFLPSQPALDTFNKEYGNKIYLLEQRPNGDWSDADNLGNYTNFISSAKVRENIFKDNSKEVNQLAFVKARLFDMFIGDWDRHEDQWKWTPVKKDNHTIYQPTPVDRDQGYAKYDGALLKPALVAAGAKYLQSFDYDIPYPQGFSYERRNIDRFFTNKVTLDQWLSMAKELHQQLADGVIEKSVRQLPPEIFAISGEEIIAKLKSRREHLEEYATKYYLFLATSVDIVGSVGRESFFVNQINDQEIEVKIFDMKDGEPRSEPYYSRIFKNDETHEIKLYALSGKDIFSVNEHSDGIKIRIIGGDKNDSINIIGEKRVHIYDDKEPTITGEQNKVRIHLSSDSAVHDFDYDAFRPEKKGLAPSVGYNDEDRLYVGLAYMWQHHSFRKKPFAFKQSVSANYSISQQAFSGTYDGLFPKIFGNWDLILKANYDAVRWSNFLGLGNQTSYSKTPTNYFRLRTAEWLGKVGITHKAGKSNFSIIAFYNSVHVLRDANKFITQGYLPYHPENLKTNSFLGSSFMYYISSTNDKILPTAGVTFKAIATYTENLSYAKKSFARFGSDVQFFIPLIQKISLSITSGAATITKSPEFYQYPAIGGGDNLRGYIRDRFRGKTAFYNSNELRFITNINSYYYRGKAGLVAFFDNGRVWMPGENYNHFHTSYGGGILVAPFNLMFFDLTYGVSKETTQIQVRGILKL